MQHPLRYASDFTPRRHIPPYLRNSSSATQSYLSYALEISSLHPQKPCWSQTLGNNRHFTVVEPQITDVAKPHDHDPPPPDCLLLVDQRPHCLGTLFIVGSQSSGFPSGKWFCAARNVTYAADLESSLLLPSTWGLIAHYVLVTYLWIPTWSDMCLSLFSKGIKRRNSNCWAQWSESSH